MDKKHIRSGAVRCGLTKKCYRFHMVRFSFCWQNEEADGRISLDNNKTNPPKQWQLPSVTANKQNSRRSHNIYHIFPNANHWSCKIYYQTKRNHKFNAQNASKLAIIFWKWNQFGQLIIIFFLIVFLSNQETIELIFSLVFGQKSGNPSQR